jgi:hypothetical protein
MDDFAAVAKACGAATLRRELVETVASGRSSCRRVWQTRDTSPVYGEHRRREIRPRSRFIEVPRTQTRLLAGIFKQKCA